MGVEQKKSCAATKGEQDFVKNRKLLFSKPAVFYSGLHKATKSKVTLVRYVDYKYKHQDMITEMVYLQQLQHSNVLEFFKTTIGGKPHHHYLVFEHFTHFLSDVFLHIRSHSITTPVIKNIFTQLLEGIDYLHSKSIVHRDIHPHTVVFNMGQLKLSSFRNACSENCVGHFPRTCQYGYQAPEVLMQLKICSSVADVWSAICILVELTIGRPLFSNPPSNTRSGVIKQILLLLGNPLPTIWPGLMDPKERICLLVKNLQSVSILSMYLNDNGKDKMSELLVKLVENGLKYDPSVRFTAKKCLSDPYLKADPIACSNNELGIFLKTVALPGR